MGIDGLTLFAQILNLLVLIWLLKRFLYRPIIKMIDERQALIQNEIQKAKEATKNAEKELATYQKQVADFDTKKNALFSQAMEEANAFKEKLSSENKQAIHLSKKNWQLELTQEKQAFDEGLQNAIITNFKTFANDALSDMADESLSNRIIKKFTTEMEKMSKSVREKFKASAIQTKQIQIETDTSLKPEERENLKTFLIDWSNLKDFKIKFVYKENPALISGICVKTGDEMIAWNLQEYLQEFETNMNTAFAELLHQEE